MPGPLEMEAELAALRAENQALRRARDSQQSLLRAIADYAPIVLYAKDLAGRFVLSNRLHASLLGRLPHEVVGATDGELLGAAVGAEIQGVADNVVATGEPHIAEFEIPLDGAQKVYLEHMFPLHGVDRIEGIGGAALDITARRRAEDEVRVFVALAEHAPDGILVRPADPNAPALANPALLRILALPADAPGERAAVWLAGTPTGAVDVVRGDGETVSLEISSFEIPGVHDRLAATATIVRDVTTLRRAVREREAQVEINRRQQAELIAELSAPLLPLAPGVLLLPLVGSLDDARSLHVREVALEGIVQHQARILIVDLTGMREVAETPADRLSNLVDAVRLIGARVILTGVRPAVAAALVEVGFGPRPGLTTTATLEDALSTALLPGAHRPR